MCKRPVFAKISQPNFVTVAPQSFEGTLLIILVSKQVSNPSLDQHPRSVLKSFPIIEAPTSDWKKVRVGISLQQSFVGQAFEFANNFLGIIFTVIFLFSILRLRLPILRLRLPILRSRLPILRLRLPILWLRLPMTWLRLPKLQLKLPIIPVGDQCLLVWVFKIERQIRFQFGLENNFCPLKNFPIVFCLFLLSSLCCGISKMYWR